MDINATLDRYQELLARRRGRLEAFAAGGERLLVIQRPSSPIWSDCNDIPRIVRHNLAYLEAHMAIAANDDLPYLEPWIGTGVYANAYGCDYVWREGEAPAVHYRYHRIAEVRDLPVPDWREAPVMRMVLECIDALKEATRAGIPIALTDTQSPFDTASLILDAADLMASCYEEPETVRSFMGGITDLVIAFSQEQAKRIGPGLVAAPGHIMHGWAGGRGISLSDDNLAVSSPTINERLALPENERIGQAFGGVAIHSCGPWASTMRRLKACPSAYMIDCALSKACDPNPNQPEPVRDALAGSGIICKVRVGGPPEEYLPVLRRVAHPDLRLMVEIPFDAERSQENYDAVRRCLGAAG